eukprot:scaffold179163_cov40-Tisochrysis_lutea.AAC.3
MSIPPLDHAACIPATALCFPGRAPPRSNGAAPVAKAPLTEAPLASLPEAPMPLPAPWTPLYSFTPVTKAPSTPIAVPVKPSDGL